MDQRIIDLAVGGLADPASLSPQEIREVCASLLQGIAPSDPGNAPQPPAETPGFVITP